MELLTLPTMDVIATGTDARRAPTFAVADPDGQVLGGVTLTATSWDGTLRRWFGNEAQYPFTLTLADTSGAALLQIEKERETSVGRYIQVVVRLADGREIGRVRQRFVLSDRVTFHGEFDGEPDAEIASAAVGAYTQGLVVEQEPGRSRVLARTDFELASGGLGSRRYRLAFDPAAPVLVRALVLGWTVAVDARLLPTGGDY